MGSIMYLLQKVKHDYKVIFADLDPFNEINTLSQIYTTEECKKIYRYARYGLIHFYSFA